MRRERDREHGIGVEKIGFMSKMLLRPIWRREAPARGIQSARQPRPDKMLPTAGGCGMEQKHHGRRAALKQQASSSLFKVTATTMTYSRSRIC